jgi:uncharacterized protein (TIGR00255 family)
MTHSMTTFARCSDQGAWGLATWEIRAVNHRFFECSFKIPEVLRSLETPLRQLAQAQLHRGKIECSLRFYPGEQSGLELTVNVPLVKKIVNALQEVKEYTASAAPVDPLKILAWPQVVQTTEEDMQLVYEKVQALFTQALTEALATRAREGDGLKTIINNKLDAIARIVAQVKEKIPQVLASQRVKILQRIEEIKCAVDQQRLEQEIVYFAQRIDVAEELERLALHVKEVKRVLDDSGSVGKRLDFLMQELNREANTLSSKSTDAEVTAAAVNLKVLIEEMREQVQNIV